MTTPETRHEPLPGGITGYPACDHGAPVSEHCSDCVGWNPITATVACDWCGETDCGFCARQGAQTRPTVEVWAVDHPLQPRQYVDTKTEALALVDAWTTANHAATCWPMRVEVA